MREEDKESVKIQSGVRHTLQKMEMESISMKLVHIGSIKGLVKPTPRNSTMDLMYLREFTSKTSNGIQLLKEQLDLGLSQMEKLSMVDKLVLS